MDIDDCLFSNDALDVKAKKIVNYLSGKIKEEYICDFKETYLFGEEGIALENICMHINSFNIKISSEIFILLKDICISYGVDLDYLKDIEHLIID
ncbi:MAG: MafI family immunity protein [bacterium]